MYSHLSSSFSIGSLQLKHRLIQGPLAGYSCAPFRALFSRYTSPAYAVSEMLSANDVIHKHQFNERYLYRSPDEQLLCYQISGTDPLIMAKAAAKLEGYNADLIDINCGCPKAKIRKKGAGSALLETPTQLISIIQAVRDSVVCPMTVKVRLQHPDKDILLAQAIEKAGADAIIVHGRKWTDDYDIACDFEQIAQIKQAVNIPVIANGDIADLESLQRAMTTECDGFMISRASTGKPWLFQSLLDQNSLTINYQERVNLFMTHLQGLTVLENEYQAVLQSRSLVRYYFKELYTQAFMAGFCQMSNLKEIEQSIST